MFIYDVCQILLSFLPFFDQPESLCVVTANAFPNVQTAYKILLTLGIISTKQIILLSNDLIQEAQYSPKQDPAGPQNLQPVEKRHSSRSQNKSEKNPKKISATIIMKGYFDFFYYQQSSKYSENK